MIRLAAAVIELPYGCVACILIDAEGQREHANDLRPNDLRPNGAGQQPIRLSEEAFKR